MDVLVKKCENLHGIVKVPGSKSYTHRVIAAASLFGSNTIIENPSNSDANAAMINACRILGADISWDDKKRKIYDLREKDKRKKKNILGR